MLGLSGKTPPGLPGLNSSSNSVLPVAWIARPITDLRLFNSFCLTMKFHKLYKSKSDVKQFQQLQSNHLALCRHQSNELHSKYESCWLLCLHIENGESHLYFSSVVKQCKEIDLSIKISKSWFRCMHITQMDSGTRLRAVLQIFPISWCSQVTTKTKTKIIHNFQK